MASEIQRCVDTIGDVLRLPVSLTDVDLNSLRFSPHSENMIDEVRRNSLLMRTTASWVRDWFAEYGVGRSMRPVRVEPHPDRQTMSRVVVPVIHRGVRLGLLSVLDPARTCTNDELDDVTELIDELATLMYDDEADRLEVSRVLHDLLTGGATARTHAIRGLSQTLGISEETECQVVAVSGVQGPPKNANPMPTQSQPTHQGASPTLAGIAQSLASDHHVFLLRVDSYAQEPLGRQLQRINRVARSCCDVPAIGVGESMALAQTPVSYEQARGAMSAVARLAHLPDQAAYSDLGAIRMLATRSDADLETAIDPRTRTLISLGDKELQLTLGTYLDNGCDAAATAAQLTVHRGTLYYRLRKAEGVTGFDLSRGDDRLTLHLGLSAHRYVSSPRRPGHAGPIRLLPV